MNVHKSNWYEIKNLQITSCPLTNGLNDLYREQPAQLQRLQVPEQIGQGYWERIRVNSFLELLICDMSFHKYTQMSSREQDNSIKWSFCLGDSVDWREEASGRTYELKAGEMSVFGHKPTLALGQYHAGSHIQGITVKMDSSRLPGDQLHPVSQVVMGSMDSADKPFLKHLVTPAMKRILIDIMRCDYEEKLKRIYLEGKVLELTAVCMHESKKGLSAFSKMSQPDIDSLLLAKEILDRDLLSAPSLSQLSRQICLNEFKLKKGFKQLFGLSVHAYIIECRLEAAYHLLETTRMNITTAASMCGFNNPSYFAEKFRQKYGAAPSHYFRNLR
ncbi:AraC family transcriptional regulator [Paenibacillus albidus]|uniref:AraC family transcriptional regulator n=1 Tax=Paenibacillus albidus TaxID=2041023 RepID=A0A917D7Z6_9BACL|nr:AraC family transcriptional regulator [Paenibacillus albidus]GGG13619.1 AraC family transcriptional regulator [Paenibacillus albidus]